MFNFENIDEYQIEITSYCNAACPQCPRNINGGRINPHLPVCHLSRDIINQRFDSFLCKRLRQIFFCGSYGDPIMHPQFLDILQDFRSKNPYIWLYVHTNGGVHNKDYWRNIAEIIGKHGQIDFGIDGLEDTLGLYRRNVNFNQVIDNATAFISAGGKAQWNFIVFAHNQHQINQARLLSKDLGFDSFLARKTGRFYHHSHEDEMPAWPVENKKGQVQYYIKPTSLLEWQNPSLNKLPELKKEYGNLKNYWNTAIISCDAAKGKKVSINSEGLVLPCNFFNHNLYDARFYNSSILPGCNELHSEDGVNQVRSFLEKYSLDSLNLHKHSLEEIFQCKMWVDLENSWTKDLDHGRLFECAMTCGQKFTKVWDQGGSPK